MIPPQLPIPDPPQWAWIVWIFGVIFCVVMLCVIGFVVFEYTMDNLGTPLEFGEVPPEEMAPLRVAKEPVQDLENILTQYVLLSPADRSRIKGGKLEFLCSWSCRRGKQIAHPPFALKLMIDELYVPWEIRYGDNTWFARIDLEPGRHKLRTVVQEIEIFVEPEDSRHAKPIKNTILGADDYETKRWNYFISHEGLGDPTRCMDCHDWEETPGSFPRPGREHTIGKWRGWKSCMVCHSIGDFEKQHSHSLKTFEDCSRCHAVHGIASGERSLLRASREELCIQCHEARP